MKTPDPQTPHPPNISNPPSRNFPRQGRLFLSPVWNLNPGICLVLGILGCAGFSPAAEPSAPSTPLRRVPPAEQRRVLDGFAAAQRDLSSVQAEFVETRRWKAFAEQTETRGRLSFAPPNRFRFERTAPHPALTVSDGKRLWIYYPEFQQVEEYALDSDPRAHEITDAVSVALGFRAPSMDEAKYATAVFAGDGAYVLELSPRDKRLRRFFSTLRIWLDADFLPCRTELVSPSGDTTQMSFSQTRRNEPLPADLFAFAPPEGVEVVRPQGQP